MKNMKKILTLALVLALTGTMAMTATAASDDDTAFPLTTAAETETVSLKADIYGNGQIAGTDDGSEPAGSDENPMQSLFFNMKKGDTAKLIAIPDEGYKFVYWLNEDTQEIYSDDAQLTITMDSPLSLKAVFDINAERCLVNVNTYGEGQIAASDYDNYDPEFNEGSPLYSLARNVIKGDTIILKAKPDKGYKFMGWLDTDTMEILSDEETYVLTADKDYNVLAAFDLDAERHLIKIDTIGSGDIAYTQDNSEPEFTENPYQSAVINIAEGRVLTVKARAKEGYKFVCWIDKDTESVLSTDETLTIDVSKDMNVTAYFDLDVERVTLIVNTEGCGQIAYSEDGTEPEFDEDPIQSAVINVIPGDTVVLKAKADEGYKFALWMNETTKQLYSMDADITVAVTEATELKAYFIPDEETVSIKVDTEGPGQIEGTDDGSEPEFNSEYPVQSIYLNTLAGNTIILVAKPSEDPALAEWKFTGWKDNATGEIVSTDARYEFEAVNALDLTAVFTPESTGDDESSSSSSDNSTPVPGTDTPVPGTDTPATGSTSSAAALAVTAAAALGVAVLSMKRRKEND